MIKNKNTRKISDSQAIKNFHQLDLEMGNEVTQPNDLKRHTIGSTKPYERKNDKTE
ncbi:hypothetical protein [Tepidibacter hydrothermalis]|uniref:Uncharacterized protein n=1 Tax=Tepidibacter hydrothermalis TaxID=3036126 RepID=A0ABY8EL76_9FIRM|nr:hypothetical protein [Tepidibacter hydrothermalis]WFD12165.1 hypothetical protein P4S50_08805 [Tepidibacter hydrothermalis]